MVSAPPMTREEAIQLYRSGEEPTVEVLLKLSRQIERIKEKVARKSDELFELLQATFIGWIRQAAEKAKGERWRPQAQTGRPEGS